MRTTAAGGKMSGMVATVATLEATMLGGMAMLAMLPAIGPDRSTKISGLIETDLTGARRTMTQIGSGTVTMVTRNGTAQVCAGMAGMDDKMPGPMVTVRVK